MQEIQLTLAVTEVNEILDALGQRPYASVYRLVAKIQAQAGEQLAETEAVEPQAPEPEIPRPRPTIQNPAEEKTDDEE